MATTAVSDYVIWAKHIHDDADLVERIRCLWAGQTIRLEVDGVSGTWRRMDDGKDGRATLGVRPIGAAQEVWRALYKERRGAVVSVKAAEEYAGVEEAPEIARRGALMFAPMGRTADERAAAIAALLDAHNLGYSSDGRTMTRDEMHER
ncbi:MAG TPA: hypothetical protein VHW60_04625 [Caulobacteraceae bacterium]|jgi:hypothetical protein|nr:hypothetical protein [Caulobacteraceae bacterium]